MKIAPVQPGCVHFSRGSFSAIFGCPSEVLKTILSKGLDMPECVVLPDSFHHEGVSLIACEFPFYHFLFIQGALAQGRKFRVIGTRDGCDRVREMLRVTLLGPSDAEMKRWKVGKKVREMLRTDLDHLALKGEGGHVLQIDEMVDFVCYDESGTARLCGNEEEPIYVRRLGGDRFALLGQEDGGDVFDTVQIPLGETIRPPYAVEMSDGTSLPSNFAVTILGASNGFDPNFPTTCYLLWVNGVGLLWDCPPFAREQLRARGVPKEAVKAIILTHVHDDHCSFLEFLLDRQRPTVITTVEVFECLLIKMGAILGESPEQVRDYMDFVEIKVGRPTKLYGATFEFFYGVHSIPAFGADISVEDKEGDPHRIYISGDTLHFKGLDEMAGKGLLAPERSAALKGFLDQDWDLCVLDGGGEPIHLAVNDYAQSDLPIVITHRSSWDGPMGPKTTVAKPGDTFEIIPSEAVHPFYAQAIFEALQLFKIRDKTWIDVLLSRGRVREIERGERVIEEGTRGDTFYFVLSGNLEVSVQGDAVAGLERGDFFGEIAILRGTERTATVRAVAPCSLFELPGGLFMDFVEANHLREAFARLWRDRQFIREVELFAGLDASAIHRITLESEARAYKKGEQIVGEKDPEAGRNIFIVKKGAVQLYEKGRAVRDHRGRPLQLRPGRYFGRHVVVDSTTLRSYSASAEADTDLLVLDVNQLEALQQEMPLIRHRIRLTMEELPGSPPAEPLRLPLTPQASRRRARAQ